MTEVNERVSHVKKKLPHYFVSKIKLYYLKMAYDVDFISKNKQPKTSRFLLEIEKPEFQEVRFFLIS